MDKTAQAAARGRSRSGMDREARAALAALHEYVLRQPAPAGEAAEARERVLAATAPFLDQA